MYIFSRYNQIKNYDFIKNEFKGLASDFTRLTWKDSAVVGFGSKKTAAGTLKVIAYYSPGGNNETSGYRENVNRVTGAGDLDVSQRKLLSIPLVSLLAGLSSQ